MKISDIDGELPYGDVNIEFELVHEGWVGYVYVKPTNGALAPSGKYGYFARTAAKPTRAEAMACIGDAFDVINNADT